jgi:NADPH:quinone reductase-like Zn-dependent oxidoreductase
MLAYIVEHPEEAFAQVDLPRPAPSAGRVLARIHASGVNPLDTKIHPGKAAHDRESVGPKNPELPPHSRRRIHSATTSA